MLITFQVSCRENRPKFILTSTTLLTHKKRFFDIFLAYESQKTFKTLNYLILPGNQKNGQNYKKNIIYSQINKTDDKVILEDNAHEARKKSL